MNYKTPAAFRTALEARLATYSREQGVDLGRLRRRVVFERLMARLELDDPGGWVLKGGIALEVRWRDRARATRDIDLARKQGLATGAEMRAALAAAVAKSIEDGFTFTVGEPRDLPTDEAGRPGWRFTVEAAVAGRKFDTVRVDVVNRPDEVTRAERLVFPSMLDFASVQPTEVEVVDRAEQFAEKLHALTRQYATGSSTRVKDLVDLVLLIEDGLKPDASLLEAVRQVFESRASHAIPAELADPPAKWAGRYADLARDLDVAAPTLQQAMQSLRAFWRDVQSHKE